MNSFQIQHMHECVNGKVMHLTLTLCDEFSTAARFQSGHEQRLSLLTDSQRHTDSKSDLKNKSDLWPV